MLQAFDRIGSSNESQFFAKIDLYTLGYTDTATPANNRMYDTNLSGGSGTALPTSSGANQGTLLNFTVPACWVFYSSGATVTGGGPATLTATLAGGGALGFAGGGVSTMAATLSGGGAVEWVGGGASAFGFTMAGGGDVLPYVPAPTTWTGGGAMSIAFSTSGGGAAVRLGGGPVTMAGALSGGGSLGVAGGGVLGFELVSQGGGTRATSGGGAVTVSVLMAGGGDVLGEGYRPTYRAPSVAVVRTHRADAVRVVKSYRAAYTSRMIKTFRGTPCRL